MIHWFLILVLNGQQAKIGPFNSKQICQQFLTQRMGKHNIKFDRVACVEEKVNQK